MTSLHQQIMDAIIHENKENLENLDLTIFTDYNNYVYIFYALIHANYDILLYLVTHQFKFNFDLIQCVQHNNTQTYSIIIQTSQLRHTWTFENEHIEQCESINDDRIITGVSKQIYMLIQKIHRNKIH